jgi:tRNA A-37 threonylcarbamoyl transferase component Bud32
MTDIIARIEQHVSLYPHDRILKLEHEGRLIWIKQYNESKVRTWHRIQRALTSLIPIGIFKTTVSDFNSLTGEAIRLRKFREKNIPVPEVIYARPGLCAVYDVGGGFRDHLRQTDNPNERLSLLKQATLTLSMLHKAGLCHGRPLLKDMTWHNGVIHFIDLEEDPLQVMSLPQAQARDLWLFLNGCVPFASDGEDDLIQLYAIYAKHASPETTRELTRMVRWLKPIRIMAQYVLMPFFGKDVRYAVIANRALERILL